MPAEDRPVTAERISAQPETETEAETDMGTRSFDHWDEQFVDDPFPEYRRMRSSGPVVRSDCYGGFWAVTRFQEVVEVCQDPITFSSRVQSIPADIGAGDMLLPPINVDPPDHSAFRRMLLPYFSPSRVAAIAPTVERIVDTLLDMTDRATELDLCSALTERLPVLVTEQLLGTPAADEPAFSGWISRLVEGGATDYGAAAEAAHAMSAYLASLMEDRRRAPRDDLTTFVTLTEAPEGTVFGENERLGCLFLLLIAGIDTTASALGTSLWHLAQSPAQWESLRGDPTMVPMAVEELLRAFAPTTVTRTTTTATVLGGHRIEAGDPLLVMLPCANRDEDRFPDADRVILDRTPNRHLAFGLGAHHCLGAGLARMELQVALRALVSSIDALSLQESAPISWKKGPIRGPKSLPVRLHWADQPISPSPTPAARDNREGPQCSM